MSDIIKLNNQIVLKPFGLINVGNTCWFNSLIQCLLSCTSFTETIIQNYDIFVNNNNIIAIEFYKLIKNSYNTQNIYNPINLLKAFIKTMQNKQFNIRDIHRIQGDPNEGFLKLIECIDNEDIETLFQIRYQTYIKCGNCNHKTKPKIEHALHIEYFDYHKLSQNNNNFTKNILYKIQKLNDYTCDKCHQKNNNTTYVHKLLRVPNVFPILFNKYYGVNPVNFPENIVNFKLVSTAIHNGSLNGGHYYACGIRHNNDCNENNFYVLNDSGFSPNNDVWQKNKPHTYFAFYHYNGLK